MRNNKKNAVSFLLLGICALFICQEILVNQVLCFKDNGAADLELAIFSFKCQCEDEIPFANPDQPESQNQRQLSSRLNDCFDWPLSGPWVKRNINNITLRINYLKKYSLDYQIILLLDDPCKRLPETVPLSKFLYNPTYFLDSVILRC